MEKILLSVMLLCLITTSSFGQKIKVNEVDKFNGVHVIETSSESLYRHTNGRGWDASFTVCLRNSNGIYSMPISFMIPTAFKFDESGYIQLLFDDGSKVLLKSKYFGVGTPQYMGFEFSTTCIPSEEDIALLKKLSLTDIRVGYLGGHYDYSISKKKSEIIKKMFQLIADEQ